MLATASGHTPGEWTLYAEKGSSLLMPICAGPDDRVICLLARSGVERPVDKRCNPRQFYTEEDIANGRLIAAAPALLKALQLIATDASSRLNAETELLACRALAREALAKVLGESPCPSPSAA